MIMNHSTRNPSVDSGRFSGFGPARTGACDLPLGTPRDPAPSPDQTAATAPLPPVAAPLPAIPSLPKKEQPDRERERTAAAPWMSKAASPQVTRFIPPALSEGGSATRWAGWLAKARTALASKTGISLVIAANLMVGGLGLWDMQRRGGFGATATEPRLATPFSGGFRAEKRTPALRDALAPAAGASQSLALAHQANAGALDRSAAPADAATGQSLDEEFAGAGAGDEDAPSREDLEAAVRRQAAEQAEQAAAGRKRDPLSGSQMNGAGRAGGLAGGAGLSGGITRPMGQLQLSGSQAAKLQAFGDGRRVVRERTMTAAGTRASAIMNSASAKKLQSMYGAMTGAASKDAQSQASTHSAQWDSAAEAGETITGAGTSDIGGAGAGTDSAAAEETGGALSDDTDADAEDSSDDSDDSAYDVEDTGETTNYTPYQEMVDMAYALLVAACALLLASYLFGLLAKCSSVYGAALYAVAKYLAYAAMALAALVTLLGLAIVATSDQTTQGAIFTGVGALLTALSYTAAEGCAEAAAAAPAAEAEAGALAGDAATNLADDIVVLSA